MGNFWNYINPRNAIIHTSPPLNGDSITAIEVSEGVGNSILL